jgi:hypothetical protein
MNIRMMNVAEKFNVEIRECVKQKRRFLSPEILRARQSTNSAPLFPSEAIVRAEK